LKLDTLGTGDSDPARLAEGYARLASRCDVIVGELLSVPTLSLATAANAMGVVVVSPTATDERIGGMGPLMFAVGPGPRERGPRTGRCRAGSRDRERGHQWLGDRRAGRVRRCVRGRSGRTRWPHRAARGLRTQAGELAQQTAALKASGASVLFWDGPARDAEGLLRALAGEGASLRLCGGPTLSPDGMRANVRPLLEASPGWRTTGGSPNPC
jgi:ABC-type branched-subunit amino acid transport system substrate-binding protein